MKTITDLSTIKVGRKYRIRWMPSDIQYVGTVTKVTPNIGWPTYGTVHLNADNADVQLHVIIGWWIEAEPVTDKKT